MAYKLKINGVKGLLTIEGISEVTGLSEDKILDIIKNRKKDKIQIGFITDIIVTESEETEPQFKPIKPKETKTDIHKESKKGRKNIFTNCIEKETPINKGFKYKYAFIIDDKRYTSKELVSKLNIEYQILMIYARKYDFVQYGKYNIKIESKLTKPNKYIYTEDGITFHKDKTITDIAKELGFRFSSLYIRSAENKDRLAFTAKNNMIFHTSFKESLKDLKFYGTDGTRYYFGALSYISDMLKIKAPHHVMKQYFHKNDIYDFAGKKIVRNYKTEWKDKKC